MLWSQEPEEPSPESRAAQAMLRRGGLLFAFLLPAVLVVILAWCP